MKEGSRLEIAIWTGSSPSHAWFDWSGRLITPKGERLERYVEGVLTLSSLKHSQGEQLVRAAADAPGDVCRWQALSDYCMKLGLVDQAAELATIATYPLTVQVEQKEFWQ